MALTQSFRQTDANITTSTGVVGPYDVTNYNTAVVAFSGTYAGITVNFEGSLDGVNWIPVFVSSVGTASVVNSLALTNNSTNAFDINIGPLTQFRVRASAYTSGTLLTQVAFGTEPYDPAPTVQLVGTPAVSMSGTVQLGTGTASIGALGVSGNVGGVATSHHLVAAATTNATSVKASAGSIGSLVLANTAAAIKFVKLFNKASAPTVGTDVPNITFGIPAGTTIMWDPANYYRMSTGIAYSITNLSPDLDATAVTAGDVIVSMQYT